MKHIALKSTTETVFTPAGAQQASLSTYELLKTVINFTPQGGFDIEEMMFRLKVRQQLEEANTVQCASDIPALLQLEDADYTKLAALAKGMKWAFASQFIVDFVNSL